jgi:hypothetical protein
MNVHYRKMVSGSLFGLAANIKWRIFHLGIELDASLFSLSLEVDVRFTSPLQFALPFPYTFALFWTRIGSLS